MRAIRLLAFLIFAGAAAFAILPSNPARATPVAHAPLVPSASPEPGGLIQPVYWHRYYWHRHYWHRHYWHRALLASPLLSSLLLSSRLLAPPVLPPLWLAAPLLAQALLASPLLAPLVTSGAAGVTRFSAFTRPWDNSGFRG